MNAPKGCMAQAFNDMLKVPGALVRVCQIAFLPVLICVVSVLVLFIPVIGGIAAAIGFLLAYVASVCGAGFAIEWGRDLSLKDDNGMERPLLRSTSFGLGIFSSVITGVLEFVAIIPVIGVVFSAIECRRFILFQWFERSRGRTLRLDGPARLCHDRVGGTGHLL